MRLNYWKDGLGKTEPVLKRDGRLMDGFEQGLLKNGKAPARLLDDSTTIADEVETYLRPLPYEEPTAEDIARYKKEWAKWFPDAEPANQQLEDLNERQHSQVPERDLLQAMLVEAMLDATGRSAYATDLCRECHEEADCDCPSATFKEEQILSFSKHHGFRVRKPNWIVPPRNCDHTTTDLGEQGVSMIDDGETYFYKGYKGDCKEVHTYKLCALKWFASPQFEETCNLLGIELGYFKRKLKELLLG